MTNQFVRGGRKLMWRMLVLCLFGVAVSFPANAAESVDLQSTTLTDAKTKSSYLQIDLPRITQPEKTGIAYAELRVSTSLPDGVDVEFWKSNVLGELPWASDNLSLETQPILRSTTLKDGSIRIDVTGLVGSSSIGVLVRLATGQEASFKNAGISSVRLIYYQVPRQ